MRDWKVVKEFPGYVILCKTLMDEKELLGLTERKHSVEGMSEPRFSQLSILSQESE